MNKSESIKELATALSLAQGQMESAKKDKENPFFKSHYSDLASVWEACREPLTKHGLSVTQLTEVEEGKLVIESVLMHKSGEWISGRLAMPITKNDPQSMGSLISYGRRYALGAIVGVVSEEDDDAEGTKVGKEKEEKKTSNTPKDQPADIEASAEGADLPCVIGTPSSVELKTGIGTNKKPWQKWGVTMHGVTYGTFSETLAKSAQAAKDMDVQVILYYKDDGKYKTIEKIEDCQ